VGRISIGRDLPVARHPDRDEAIIRELRRRAVEATLSDMAVSAVPLVGV